MSDGEVEVIEVKASNSLVPNLTISIEKDQEGEAPTVEFVDEVEEDAEKSGEVKEEKQDGVEFKIEAKSFPHTKIYENKMLKEMGMTAEEAKLRKQNRSRRFQSPMLRGEVEPDDSEGDLVKKIISEVDEINQTIDPWHMIRLDAIHLRGLDDMSTKDIFSFFADQFPSHIEWIDDTSCNVVWKDNDSASTALLKLSKPIISGDDKVEEKIAPKDESVKDSKPKQEEDDLDLMESDDEDKMEVENGFDKKPTQETENKKFANELRDCIEPFVRGSHKVWLQMRLAVDSDKKTLGGAKKSQYYRKYGNPNYGNMRGLLSRSFMKRYHGRVAKREYEGYKPGVDEVERSDDIERKHNSAMKTAAKKRKMYSEQAWDESKKAKNTAGEDESGTSSDESEEEDEKEDRELMNSSAKDLEDAIPGKKVDDYRFTREDTLRADRIAKKIEAARRSQEVAAESGNLNVSVRGNSVWARLGKIPHPETKEVEITVKNEPLAHQKKVLEQDKEVNKRLPAKLRDRLGAKKF